MADVTLQIKELCKLRDALDSLLSDDKWKIVQFLKESNKPVSYSEIKRLFGEDYNDNTLWRHLKSLEEADLIEHIKGMVEYNPASGKPRFSFYKLSEYGRRLVDEFLEKIIQDFLLLRNNSN